MGTISLPIPWLTSTVRDTGCHSCSNRRTTRLRRGELFTPTGYAGELINNQTGRIIAGTLDAVA